MNPMHEHDDEPVVGLPQELPEGERILWQGRSEFSSLALTTMHIRKVAVYFAALLALRIALALKDGQALIDAVSGSIVLLVLAVVAIGLLAYYAQRAAAATMFTITNQRVVMRCGVAVSVTVNLPFAIIDAADLRLHKDGSGDISIRTDRSSRASYVLLWPMVKPFRWFDVRPVLRGIRNAESVAKTLATALADYAADAAARPVSDPSTDDSAPAPRRGWSLHPPLAAASALIVFAIVAVSMYQLSDRGNGDLLLEPAIESVDLWFEDQEGGAVTVIDANSGRVVDVVAPETNGFLRGALRSLARERRASDIGSEIPFSVRKMASGSIVLHDPATGRVIDLRAFGPTNQEAFARFLEISAKDQIADGGPSEADAAETGVAAVALTQQETK